MIRKSGCCRSSSVCLRCDRFIVIPGSALFTRLFTVCCVTLLLKTRATSYAVTSLSMAEKTSALKPGPPKVTPLRGRDNRRPSLFAVANRLRKKRDGTPEKSATPSQEPDETLTPAKQVIWDQALEKLQIKQEELQKTWQPRPPASDAPPAVRKVPVQKAKKLQDSDKPKSRMISVAKPAPPDAPVKPMDYTGYAGPRYDQHGDVIQHSLLGTLEDFQREAARLAAQSGAPELPASNMDRSDTPTVKYEKKRRGRDVRLSRDDNNALRHWQLKMMERKRQQGYISKLLQKNPEDLAMNQADNFRQVQEQRHMIDRTIPRVDYGKGYRVGSEFWHQQEQFGDDLGGLHMTLSQSQRGYPPPVMHVGLSQVVKQEKGSEWLGRRSPHMNYPWHKSEFLSQRKGQLQPYMEEMDPFRPDFDFLQVIGSNQPYRSAEEEQREKDEEFDKFLDSYGGHGLPVPLDEDTEADDNIPEDTAPALSEGEGVVKKEPVFGPSLLFGGQAAQWTGDSFSFKDQVGIEARVTFEALTGDRVTSHLQLINDGTTSIYYDWKKMTKENPFDLVQAQVQRFYFNNSSGVILPGETLKFPYVFKSPNAGVFTEQWRLETRPVVCGGASLLVTLRGVALQEDKFKKQREELERELVQKQAKQVVSQLLSDVIAGIRTPERSRSPVDAYITEEEIFCRNNPGLQYSHQDVAQLKELYGQLWEEDLRAENVWSLSIPDLQDSIIEHAEDDERRENLLHQMNLVVGRLSYLPHKSVQQQLQSVGYLLFQEAIDRTVGESLLLRQAKGLPDRAQDEIDGDINRLRSSDSRKGPRGVDSKVKVDPGKDKGRATGRDSKAAKVPPAKPDPKGKTTPGPTPKKTPTPVKNAPTPSRALTPAEREGGVEGSNSQPPSPEPGVGAMSDVELAMAEKLYKESFSVQVYNILGEMLDKMDMLFSGIKNNEI